MTLLIEQYTRKPFDIEAVQVTLENLEEVAKWCGGEIIVEKKGDGLVQYIKADVNQPMSERQTKAFIGEWVLKTNNGFKCYGKKAFAKCFVKVEKQLELFDSV